MVKIPDCSGIYVIENILNHKKYIGSSINIKRRFQYHKSMLRRNEHDNNHLRSAWNRYGEDNFEFYILLKCDKDMLLMWEKEAFRLFKCCEREFGYNLQEDPTTTKPNDETRKKLSLASSGERNPNFGKTHSVTTIKKISEARTGQKVGYKRKSPPAFTEEHCKKLSEASIGNKSHLGKTHSLETKLKMSIARKKYLENKKQHQQEQST
mgnify:FL=1